MTLAALLSEVQKRLLPVSDGDAAADSRELVSFVLKRRVGLRDGEIVLSEEQRKLLDSLIERRLAHEPLQYIIGEWDLMGITFRVSPAVLIPRQDTETLVAEAERLIREKGYRTLADICTGSGCIGIALAVRTGVKTLLSDVSSEALAVAKTNAEMHGADCEIAGGDLFAALAGRRFDIITINPPYIPSETVRTLAPEVRREPVLALDGGPDGLAFYRRIRERFTEHLMPGGALVMEIGFDQGESVPALFKGTGAIEVIRDLNDNDRVVTVITAGEAPD